MNTEAIVSELFAAGKHALRSRHDRTYPTKVTAHAGHVYADRSPTGADAFDRLCFQGEMGVADVFHTQLKDTLADGVNGETICADLTVRLSALANAGVGFEPDSSRPPRMFFCTAALLCAEDKNDHRHFLDWLKEELGDVFAALQQASLTIACSKLAITDGEIDAQPQGELVQKQAVCAAGRAHYVRDDAEAELDEFSHMPHLPSPGVVSEMFCLISGVPDFWLMFRSAGLLSGSGSAAIWHIRSLPQFEAATNPENNQWQCCYLAHSPILTTIHLELVLFTQQTSSPLQKYLASRISCFHGHRHEIHAKSVASLTIKMEAGPSARRGRPPGAKDKPRKEGIPPRGRPRKHAEVETDDLCKHADEGPRKRQKSREKRNTLPSGAGPVPARANLWMLHFRVCSKE
ncbi:hypothetical protein C8R43DRAFT_959299 [Mycena crocata]|nr:hypothetical protein C8R43DRAFT_959299 [Mycena crocata]